METQKPRGRSRRQNRRQREPHRAVEPCTRVGSDPTSCELPPDDRQKITSIATKHHPTSPCPPSSGAAALRCPPRPAPTSDASAARRVLRPAALSHHALEPRPYRRVRSPRSRAYASSTPPCRRALTPTRPLPPRVPRQPYPMERFLIRTGRPAQGSTREGSTRESAQGNTRELAHENAVAGANTGGGIAILHIAMIPM